MKTIIPTYFLFVLCSINAFGQNPEIKIDQAQVTIPYAELKKILHAAQLAETKKDVPKPPVEAVLNSAVYLLDFSSEIPTLSAKFSARTFTDVWHTVPLFGGDPRLEEFESANEFVSVIRKDETYSLLINKSGEFTASLNLTVPNPKDWSKKEGLRFRPATAARSELHVTGLSKGKILRIKDLSPGQSDGRGLVYHLPDNSDDLQIFLEDDVLALPAKPSQWTLYSQVAIRYDDGRLKQTARIQCQADTGSGVALSLPLPATVSRLKVEGEDLDDWKLEPRTADSRLLQIFWNTRDILDRTLTVSWETPQSPLAKEWNLPALNADSEDSGSTTLYAIAPVDGLELVHPSLKNAAESRRLPSWLQEQLGGGNNLSIEISGGEAVTLTANWLPRLETAQATVSLANFETRLVADGSMLVKADYTIQHGAAINWKLEMPAIDQILSCEINCKAVNPIKRGDDEIEFRLSAPEAKESNGETCLRGTTVRLSYSLKSDVLDPVSGKVDLELPRTDLFIHRLDWALTIPAKYEPTAIEGNVQLSNKKPISGNTPNLIQLEKELCRGERPTVEIYYQRKDINTKS